MWICVQAITARALGEDATVVSNESGRSDYERQWAYAWLVVGRTQRESREIVSHTVRYRLTGFTGKR